MKKMVFYMAFLSLWGSVLPAQTLYEQRQALTKLESIYVKVAIPNHAELRGQLAEKNLQTKIELKLRNNGLKIVDTHFSPELGLLVTILQPTFTGGKKVRGYFYHIALTLRDVVWSDRLPRVEAFVWAEQYTGICHEDGLVSAVNEAVVDLTESFANDYLAANQAEEKKPSIYDIIGKDDE